MPEQYVVYCKNQKCQLDTVLPLPVLEGIVPNLAGSPTGKEFLDFVCPHCGTGYRYLCSEIPKQQFSLNLNLRQHDPPMFHVSLKCVVADCATHARVHTLAASEQSNTIPRIALSEWKVHGITCFDGHPVREPLEPLSSETIAPL